MIQRDELARHFREVAASPLWAWASSEHLANLPHEYAGCGFSLLPCRFGAHHPKPQRLAVARGERRGDPKRIEGALFLDWGLVHLYLDPHFFKRDGGAFEEFFFFKQKEVRRCNKLFCYF